MSRRGSLRLAVAGVALAVATASCSMVGATVAPTLAAWPLAPIPPDPAMVDLMSTAGGCPAQVPGDEPWRALIEDQRTPGVAVFLLATPKHFGTCLVQRGGGSSGSSGDLPAAPFTGIALDGGGTDVLDRGEGIATYRGGRADSRVAVVIVHLPNGEAIEATVSRGYWLASWQGNDLPTSVEARDALGQLVGTLENPK